MLLRRANRKSEMSTATGFGRGCEIPLEPTSFLMSSHTGQLLQGADKPQCLLHVAGAAECMRGVSPSCFSGVLSVLDGSC